jgi:ABC-type multidrug transport system fused ATPase/permease subunit
MWSKKNKLEALIFSVLFLTILKYIIDHGAEALPQVLQLTAHASLPVAGGLITLSLGSLLGTFTVAKNSAASHLLRQASKDPARNFFTGFLITAYLNLVRPPLTVNLPFLPYIEWVVIVLAVYVVYSMTRLSTKEFYVSSEGSGWKRHIQEVRRETGHNLMRVTSVMEQFVEQGVKEPLLVYLTLHLQRLGETEEDILKILRPLIDYQKAGRHKLYFLFFPWTKRKIAIRNKKAREVLLNTLLEKIDRL